MIRPIPSATANAAALSEPLQENRFSYLILNMHYTLDVWNDPSAKRIQSVHLVGSVALFPLALIAACEAVYKNGFFLLANLGIAAANKTYQILHPHKKELSQPIPAPASALPMDLVPIAASRKTSASSPVPTPVPADAPIGPP